MEKKLLILKNHLRGLFFFQDMIAKPFHFTNLGQSRQEWNQHVCIWEISNLYMAMSELKTKIRNSLAFDSPIDDRESDCWSPVKLYCLAPKTHFLSKMRAFSWIFKDKVKVAMMPSFLIATFFSHPVACDD